jgi:DNA-binding response OmpR family regulator
MQNVRKNRILIIEDDLEFSESLRVLLLNEGYVPQLAEDAVEGGKALLAEKPDLVICDVKMPYMNGLELLALLRSNEDTRSLPVIIVSGHIDIMGKAMDLGASDFLLKPLTRAQLLNSIDACLKADTA